MVDSLALDKNRLLHFIIVIMCILILGGCEGLKIEASFEIRNYSHDIIESEPCYAVSGTVLGKLKPNSNVTLFKSDRTEFDHVMDKVIRHQPFKSASINKSQTFQFECLHHGSYVLAIPVSSYNHSMGAPLPFEFDCPNASLRIRYQGGDSSHWVGVFTLNTSTDVKSKPGPRFHPCPT